MAFSTWITKSWPDIVAAAGQALKNQDLATLADIDAVIRDRFLGISRRREPVSDFVSALLEILAAAPDRSSKFVIQWEALVELAEGLERVEAGSRNALEQHVKGRPRREQIVDHLRQHGETRFRDLRDALSLSDAHLSGLLGELEAHEIVVRYRAGNETRVRPGPAAAQEPRPEFMAAIERWVPREDWPEAVSMSLQ